MVFEQKIISEKQNGACVGNWSLSDYFNMIFIYAFGPKTLPYNIVREF